MVVVSSKAEIALLLSRFQERKKSPQGRNQQRDQTNGFPSIEPKKSSKPEPDLDFPVRPNPDQPPPKPKRIKTFCVLDFTSDDFDEVPVFVEDPDRARPKKRKCSAAPASKKSSSATGPKSSYTSINAKSDSCSVGSALLQRGDTTSSRIGTAAVTAEDNHGLVEKGPSVGSRSSSTDSEVIFTRTNTTPKPGAESVLPPDLISSPVKSNGNQELAAVASHPRDARHNLDAERCRVGTEKIDIVVVDNVLDAATSGTETNSRNREKRDLPNKALNRASPKRKQTKMTDFIRGKSSAVPEKKFGTDTENVGSSRKDPNPTDLDSLGGLQPISPEELPLKRAVKRSSRKVCEENDPTGGRSKRQIFAEKSEELPGHEDLDSDDLISTRLRRKRDKDSAEASFESSLGKSSPEVSSSLDSERADTSQPGSSGSGIEVSDNGSFFSGRTLRKLVSQSKKRTNDAREAKQKKKTGCNVAERPLASSSGNAGGSKKKKKLCSKEPLMTLKKVKVTAEVATDREYFTQDRVQPIKDKLFDDEDGSNDWLKQLHRRQVLLLS